MEQIQQDKGQGRDYTGDKVLDVMHLAVNRNKIIEDTIRSYFKFNDKSDPALLCEFGAGKGEFIDRFATIQGVQTLAVEIDPDFIKSLSKTHDTYVDIAAIKHPLDWVFSLDVIEHIEDDLQALKDIYKSLKPGGKLLLYVPARPELYSDYDRSIGHYRRYTKSELREKCRKAGFIQDNLYYQDLIGYFAAAYNKLTFNPKKGADLDAGMVKIYDKYLIPLTKAIETIIPIPFGRSLFYMGHKARH